MSLFNRIAAVSGAGAIAALALAGVAFAQDAPVTPVMDKGDVAWMLTCTVLVTAMIVPGLALFYGGLVRSKNMLSVLTQVFAIFCIAILVWVGWGYSLAFDPNGESVAGFVGGFSRVFLAGVDASTMAATFDANYVIPEFVFIAFQMTFAGITAALIVGALAERVKFAGLIVFVVLWLTIVYAPIAHMVWAAGGILFEAGDREPSGGSGAEVDQAVTRGVFRAVLRERIAVTTGLQEVQRHHAEGARGITDQCASGHHHVDWFAGHVIDDHCLHTGTRRGHSKAATCQDLRRARRIP